MELTRFSTIYGYDFYMPRGLVKSQQREIEETGVYERATSETIFRFVERGMRVMDCGSNCGFHALNLARATGPTGKVYCLEANPELIEVLKENIRQNGFHDIVEIFNMGIWKENTTLRFPLRTRGLGGAGFKRKSRNPIINWKARRRVKDWVKIEVTSLSTFCRDRSVDLVRMDVEGAEYEAILGSQALLGERDMTLIMEWIPQNTTRRITERLFGTLKSCGYWIYRITNRGLIRIESGRDFFERHWDVCRAGQRDVLCLKRDEGPLVERWWD